jgi:hypothetical protein
MITGPFSAATDPNVGYPPTVSPTDYVYAEEQVVPNVNYRLLDGVVTNGTFAFWFSPLDLWSGWCALQTPYAWNVGGESKYRCVPQIATPANTDVGKFDLCTYEFDGPQCTNRNGEVYPCACLDSDGGTVDGGPTGIAPLPGCGAAIVCGCSATQCQANLRGSEIGATLTLAAGKLVGYIQFWPPSPPPGPAFTFQRVTQ